MQLRLSLKRAALALSLATAATICPADSVLDSIIFEDNRVMDLFGTYPMNGPAGLNAQVYMFNSNTGEVLVSTSFGTPSGIHTVPGGSFLKGKGFDGASFKVKAKNEEGYSVKLTANYEGVGNGQFVVTGKISGPDVKAEFSGIVHPSDTSRGFIISARQASLQVPGGFTWTATHPAFDGSVSSPHFTNHLGATQFLVTEPDTNIKVVGEIVQNGPALDWVPGTSPATYAQGKFKLKVPQSRVSIMVDEYTPF
jgi:hypothetical protein